MDAIIAVRQPIGKYGKIGKALYFVFAELEKAFNHVA